jgi:N-acetylglucosaminyldiphosphoundecaprenol N-acetyl-beta-D-mannosaminyltransferase
MNHRYVGNSKLFDGTNQELFDTFLDSVKSSKGGYICFCSTHTVVMAGISSQLANVLRGSLLNCPDGKPLTWGRYGPKNRFRGVDFLRSITTNRELGQIKMLVLGGAERHAQRYQDTFESFNRAGMDFVYKPLPMFSYTNIDLDEPAHIIEVIEPRVVWLALGSPKQELVVRELSRKFPHVLFLTVGAALDFISEVKSEAPYWIRRIGFEWLFRLFQEPIRLGNRYFYGNSAYIFLFLSQHLARKSAPQGFLAFDESELENDRK